MQNNPHSPPRAYGISLPTRAEGLRTALRAYPKPDAENPGLNPKLLGPPPAPIHNPSGRLPLCTLPLPPAPAAIRCPWNVSVTRSSSSMNTVLEAPQPRVAQRGMGRRTLRAQGTRSRGSEGGKLRGRSWCEGESAALLLHKGARVPKRSAPEPRGQITSVDTPLGVGPTPWEFA